MELEVGHNGYNYFITWESNSELRDKLDLLFGRLINDSDEKYNIYPGYPISLKPIKSKFKEVSLN